MVDQAHLSAVQKALISPIITHGSFYHFAEEASESLAFIEGILTAIVKLARPGYKQLKVTFFGSTSHGTGYDAQDIVFNAMREVRRKMSKGLRVTVGYELQVSREEEVSPEEK